MSDKSIKIVKVDPTGFFVKKDEDTKDSFGSRVSDESSISSVSSGGSKDSESNLNPLPNVSPPISVIKEEKIVEPPSAVVVTNNAQEMAQANNYLSTSVPKINKIEEVKVSNIPFQNNTREESTEDTMTTTRSESESSSSESSVSRDTDDEEVIDMTDNTLYTVLAAVLEDEDGNNVSENLSSINRHLEKHNETLEKILSEYAEINRERGREKRYFEQMAQAINNQTRVLEKMSSVFDAFLRNQGVKPEKNIQKSTIIEDEEEDEIEGGRKFEKKPSRRIETPENTGKHHSKIKVVKN